MGHLTFLKQEYRDLVHRLDAGQVGLPEPESPEARRGLREILEILYTREEAALASRMPVMPATLSAIARRTGLPEPALAVRLDAMADKGLVVDLVRPDGGPTKWMLAPPVVGFFEFSLMRLNDGIPKQRMAEALEAYTHGDDTFAREVFGADTVVGRALVHETALPDPRPDVLDWERATALVRDGGRLSVTNCYCRHKAEHLGTKCDAPLETCLSLGNAADFLIRRGFSREIERNEALEILARSRESGLVQIADNVKNRPGFVCNCCGCCCGMLAAINDFGLDAVNPSGFEPVVDEDACKGCGRCARDCPVAAIRMTAVRDGGAGRAHRRNRLHPEFDRQTCIGCGVCADTCRNEALSMRRGEVRPYVPENTIERVVRMALERGRLAHLIADEGAGRGAQFLNHVIQALTRLPPAERLLASEQVRSRFVRAALARVGPLPGVGEAGPGGRSPARTERRA